MRTRSLCLLISVTASVIAFSPGAAGEDLNNNELKFTGTISSVEASGDGASTLLVRLQSLEVRVVINSATDVQDTDGDELEIASLVEGNSFRSPASIHPTELSRPPCSCSTRQITHSSSAGISPA